MDLISDKTDLFVTSNTCNNNYVDGMVFGSFSGLAASNNVTALGTPVITMAKRESWSALAVDGLSQTILAITTEQTCGNRYGRGIELFGGSTKPGGPGIVCYNECSYNYNYGGVVNNGTEGVGIGFDDYHRDIRVYGNLLVRNEGNGIQMNPVGASGSSSAYGNILIDNFSAPLSRSASWSD